MRSYSEVYALAMAWHKSHRNPKTDDDWLRIAHDFCVFDNSAFEAGLGIAIMDELERECKKKNGNQSPAGEG